MGWLRKLIENGRRLGAGQGNTRGMVSGRNAAVRDSPDESLPKPLISGVDPSREMRSLIVNNQGEAVPKVIVLNEITNPSVYLINHSQLAYNNDGNIELERFLDEQTTTKGEKQKHFFTRPGQEHLSYADQLDAFDLDNIPEVAGRLCYMSFDKPRPGGNMTYIEHIKETGHGSVLEHAVFGFIGTGISRSLTHELVRHRAGFGFSQLSQRFVDHEPTTASGAWSFVCPLALTGKGMEKARAIWQQSMMDSARAYEELSDELGRVSGLGGNGEGNTPRLSVKQQREAARSVLPNATETKIFFSCNARALRHLFHMRGSIHADREIRRFVRRTYEKVMELDVCQALLSDVSVTDDENDVISVKYPHV